MYPYVTRLYLDVTHMYWYVLVSVYTFHVYYPPAIVCCSYVFVCNQYIRM